MKTWGARAGVALLVACTSEPRVPPTESESMSPPAAGSPESSDFASPATETADGTSSAGGEAFVLETTSLYRTGSRARRVEVDGKTVSNYLATLFRGEPVDVRDRGKEFVEVVASDGTRGFLKASLVLETKGAAATVTSTTKTFQRPALVALGKAELEPGALVFVIGAKGEFSEINYLRSRTAWVLTESLELRAASIAVSRLLHRVRSLKDDDAKEHGRQIETLVELAKSTYPDSPILPTLVEEIDPEAAERLREALASVSERASGLRFALHGSTPALSWSPNGSRLLANSAYEYFGFEKELERDEDDLGVFVIDVETGTRTRIWRQQAYHPIWMSDTQIAWGISDYETSEEESGLYVATLTGDEAAVRRVSQADSSVFNTQPSKSGGVVYFSGNWTPKAGWFRYDPREDRVSTLVTVGESEGASWDPPRRHIRKDGCVQSAAQTTVRVDGEGIYVNESRISEVPPMTFEPQGGRCEDLEGHCGYLLPCVSPDGKRVAVVRSGEARGELELEVIGL